MNLLCFILGIAFYDLIMPFLESAFTTVVTWFTLKQNQMAVEVTKCEVERAKIENEINQEETNCIGFVAPEYDNEEENDEI